ncbi:uncharacterized [Tachysurus ichikawai]
MRTTPYRSSALPSDKEQRNTVTWPDVTDDLNAITQYAMYLLSSPGSGYDSSGSPHALDSVEYGVDPCCHQPQLSATVAHHVAAGFQMKNVIRLWRD